MTKIVSQLLSITKTQTIKDAALVFTGMALSTVLSAASIFLLARFLGPAKFGLYTTSLALAIIVTDAIDLSIGGSIIKFGSKLDKKSGSFIKYGFLLKLFLGFSLGGLFALISQPLADWLHPEIKTPLLLSSLFIPAVFLLRFPRALLQSQKKFLKDSTLEVTTSFLRLGFVLGFYCFFQLTVVTALLAYLFSATGAFLIAVTFVSWRFLKAPITKNTKQDFFSFQKWLTLGFIIAAVHGRIDSAILLKLVGPVTTGIYQAAYRFFMPVIQLAAALSLVFAPRFASFGDKTKTRTYLIKSSQLTLAVSFLVFLIIPLAPLFVKLIYGSDYVSAVLPTQILSIGFFAFLAGAPFVSHLIYSKAKTKIFFFLSIFQLTLIVSLNFLLVPSLKAVGAAIAASLTLVIVNTLTAAIALKTA